MVGVDVATARDFSIDSHNFNSTCLSTGGTPLALRAVRIIEERTSPSKVKGTCTSIV